MGRARGAVLHGRRLYEAVRPGARLLPSFLVIGAKRSGSTSLSHLIAEHPDVQPCLAAKGTHFFDVRHREGWDWYRAQFPRQRADKITGEASPYYLFHPLAATRIADALPGVRLIAVLREPVARAYSSYHYEARHGLEPLSFESAVQREADRLDGEERLILTRPGYESFEHRHHGYLARGRYAEQLERFLDRFPSADILIIQSERLLAEPASTMARVFEFLDLRSVVVPKFPIYEAATYQEMRASTRDMLGEYFTDHNKRLYELPGVDFRWTTTSFAGRYRVSSAIDASNAAKEQAR